MKCVLVRSGAIGCEKNLLRKARGQLGDRRQVVNFFRIVSVISRIVTRMRFLETSSH